MKKDAQAMSFRILPSMVVIVLCALIAGCVINPYIKTAAVPRNDPIAPECKVIGGGPVNAGHARKYAECVRRTMESKAGRYAWMNNGGGALLMQMAGFAGYSGVRGGHQAQVAAFTTGGASLYGAQQYLYRKPREAIYWSGSNAIGCAIGVTERRILVASEAKKAESDMQGAYAEKRIKLETTIRALSGPEALIEDLDYCDAKTQNDWAALQSGLKEIRSPEALAETGARRDAIYRQLLNLGSLGEYSRIDLIATTNAIRDTVNRQLAIEQPDPAELTKLLAALKLPALEAAATAKPKTVSPSGESPLGIAYAKIPRAQLSQMLYSYDFGDSTLKRCGFDDAEFEAFRSAAEAVFDAQAALDQTLKDMQANVDTLEARAKAETEGSSQLKYCTLAKVNTLMPFGLQLAQQGTQKVAEGQTLFIPITGGVPPYAITVLPGAAAGITATPKATDDGGYKIEIGTGSAKKTASAMFFANDAVGAGTVFSVEVVAK